MGDGRAYFFTMINCYLVTIYLYKFEHDQIHHNHVTVVRHVIYCTYESTLTKGKYFYSTRVLVVRLHMDIGSPF